MASQYENLIDSFITELNHPGIQVYKYRRDKQAQNGTNTIEFYLGNFQCLPPSKIGNNKQVDTDGYPVEFQALQDIRQEINYIIKTVTQENCYNLFQNLMVILNRITGGDARTGFTGNIEILGGEWFSDGPDPMKQYCCLGGSFIVNFPISNKLVAVENEFTNFPAEDVRMTEITDGYSIMEFQPSDDPDEYEVIETIHNIEI